MTDRILYSGKTQPQGGRVLVLVLAIAGLLVSYLAASLARSAKWTRRIIDLSPLIFLLMTYLLGEQVFLALWLDRIVGGRRGRHNLYTLADDPSSYWIWVGIHIGLCVISFFMTFVAWAYRHETLVSAHQKTRGNQAR